MFVGLGPGSFLAFGDIMCTLAAVVFAALWYIGSKTPRHIGESMTWGHYGGDWIETLWCIALKLL